MAFQHITNGAAEFMRMKASRIFQPDFLLSSKGVPTERESRLSAWQRCSASRIMKRSARALQAPIEMYKSMPMKPGFCVRVCTIRALAVRQSSHKPDARVYDMNSCM